MNRLLIYSPAAAVLIAIGRFQEVTIYRNGHIQSQHGLYGQLIGAVICVAIGVACLVATARQRTPGVVREPWFRLRGLRFWPWAFALPLVFWQHSTTIQEGGDAYHVNIVSGLGGPFTLVYFLAASFAFTAGEVFLKTMEMRRPEPASSAIQLSEPACRPQPQR
jgi:hypothetical protein